MLEKLLLFDKTQITRKKHNQQQEKLQEIKLMNSKIIKTKARKQQERNKITTTT